MKINKKFIALTTALGAIGIAGAVGLTACGNDTNFKITYDPDKSSNTDPYTFDPTTNTFTVTGPLTATSYWGFNMDKTVDLKITTDSSPNPAISEKGVTGIVLNNKPNSLPSSFKTTDEISTWMDTNQSSWLSWQAGDIPVLLNNGISDSVDMDISYNDFALNIAGESAVSCDFYLYFYEVDQKFVYDEGNTIVDHCKISSWSDPYKYTVVIAA